MSDTRIAAVEALVAATAAVRLAQEAIARHVESGTPSPREMRAAMRIARVHSGAWANAIEEYYEVTLLAAVTERGRDIAARMIAMMEGGK